MNYFTSLGKTFKDYLEYMVQQNQKLFETADFDAVCKVDQSDAESRAHRSDP
jgi:hypothetical protein